MTPYCIITSSKGRLAHLKQTLPTWLAHTPCNVVVVDAGCPDGTAAWAAKMHPERVAVRATGSLPQAPFSKPEALNYGVHYALYCWSSTAFLLFLDADTIVHPRMWSETAGHFAADSMLIVTPSQAARDLTGVLGVHQREFFAVGGYDREFAGWGAEDLDLRLRLYLRRRLRPVELPPTLFAAIPHDDELRTRHYLERDKARSHMRNLQRAADNAAAAAQLSIIELLARDPMVSRLLGADASPGSVTVLHPSPDGDPGT